MDALNVEIGLSSIEEMPRLNHVSRWEIMRYNGSPVTVDLHVRWQPYISKNEIALFLGVDYSADRDMVKRELLSYNVQFVFSIPDIESALEVADNRIIIPQVLMAVMLSVGIGSMRGMLALRAAGSFLRHHPLPIISITDLMDTLRDEGRNRYSGSLKLSGDLTR